MPDMIEFVVKYWLEVLFGLITLGVSTAWKVSSKKRKNEREKRLEEVRRHDEKEAQIEKELSLLKDGVVALLHDRIYEIGENCLLSKGITVSQLDNLERLYSAYEPLGGNGTGSTMVNNCRRLPLCEDGDFDV